MRALTKAQPGQVPPQEPRFLPAAGAVMTAEIVGARGRPGDFSQIDYGSFCSRVRMFCGIVLAWATIAVLACCRIWALDSAEVAAA